MKRYEHRTCDDGGGHVDSWFSECRDGEYVLYEDAKKILAQRDRLLKAAKLVPGACVSLMAEACGRGAADWGAVNTMLCDTSRAIADCKED